MKKKKEITKARRDGSNICNCRTRAVATFIIFCGISKYLRIYSTISLEAPNGVVWNPKVPRNTV